MEEDKLVNLINSNIHKLKNINTYKSILRLDNNLSRIDILNRLLICIQKDNVFDIRTESEWLTCNRRVKDKNDIIYIVAPISESKYIDSCNGNIIKDELNLNELSMAIKYGIVHKENYVETLCIYEAFDIKNTISNSKDYKPSKKVLSTSSILNICADILSCSIEQSDINYYSATKKIIFVKKDKYSEIVKFVTNTLTDYYVSKISKDVYINNEYKKDLIRNSIQFIIETAFKCNINSTLASIQNIDINEIIEIIYSISPIYEEVASYINNSDDILNRNISYSVDIDRRAEIILDIMDANYVNKSINNRKEI